MIFSIYTCRVYFNFVVHFYLSRHKRVAAEVVRESRELVAKMKSEMRDMVDRSLPKFIQVASANGIKNRIVRSIGRWCDRHR